MLFLPLFTIGAQQVTETIDTIQYESFNVTEEEEYIQDSTDDPVIWEVDENASFQGGDITTFSDWITEHIQYPIEASEAKISGKVIAQFSVNKKGKVCDIKIVKTVHPLLDNEVIRVIKSSPDWKPAKQSGVIVKQNFAIPVIFYLHKKSFR